MNEQIIQQTKNWIEKVVVGNNFCPFAARELARDSIRYVVCDKMDDVECLEVLIGECKRLDEEVEVETTFIIYNTMQNMGRYLFFYEMSQQLLKDWGFEGVYQLATFHPEYLFADAAEDDPANYTNRSPYPMLHILREASVEKAIANHPDAEGIPQRNIAHARREGLTRMKRQRDDCMKADTNR